MAQRSLWVLVHLLAAACASNEDPNAGLPDGSGADTSKPDGQVSGRRPSAGLPDVPDARGADTRTETDARTDARTDVQNDVRTDVQTEAGAHDGGTDAGEPKVCFPVVGTSCDAVGATCGYATDACFTTCKCSASRTWECSTRCSGDDCVPTVREDNDCITHCRCVQGHEIGSTVQECVRNCGVARECAVGGTSAACDLPAGVACNFFEEGGYQRPLCLCEPSRTGGPGAGGTWRCTRPGVDTCGPAGQQPRCPGELCRFWSGASTAHCTCEGTIDSGPNTRWSCVDGGRVP